jgi:hypothetical protein
VFVTSQGSAYSQFKRALDRRNFLLAWTMAAELPLAAQAEIDALYAVEKREEVKA